MNVIKTFRKLVNSHRFLQTSNISFIIHQLKEIDTLMYIGTYRLRFVLQMHYNQPCLLPGYIIEKRSKVYPVRL